MVKYLKALLLSVLMCGVSQAQVCIDNPELPQSFKAYLIRSVTVKRNFASSEDRPDICTTFALGEGDVRDFFRYAKRIDASMYNYIYSTGCYSEGEIVFRNGKHGLWRISSDRLAVLTLSDGRCAYYYGWKARAKVFGEIVDPRPDFGLEPEPSTPVQIGNIKSITFKENLTWDISDEQSSGKCHFKLSESDVRDFFLHARVVDFKIYQAKVYGKGKQSGIQPAKGCQVEGEIVFADGREGSWMIRNNRVGILDIFHGDRAFLYAKDAKSKAFLP